MAAWRDVEGRAMRDSLSRLRVDASKATAGGEEEDTRPIDPRPLLVKAFGKDVVDKILNPDDEPAVPPKTRRGRRQSMEFEDLHLHTETGKLLLPPALQTRLGSRNVTSTRSVANALADPVWAGDPEAIHSVRRPLRTVQQQRRDHFVQIASSSHRARAGTFSHADRQFIRAKLSPLHADKPGSPSSPRVPGSPLPGNRHGTGSPKGGKQTSTPLRKISTGSMSGKDVDTGRQSATPHSKSSTREDDGNKQASPPYRKISTGSMSSRDAELTSVHAKGGYSPATSRKVSSTSVSSRDPEVTSGTGGLQQSPTRSRKTSTISIVSSSSSNSSGGGGGKKDGGSPRRKTSTSKQTKDDTSPSPPRKTSTGRKK